MLFRIRIEKSSVGISPSWAAATLEVGHSSDAGRKQRLDATLVRVTLSGAVRARFTTFRCFRGVVDTCCAGT